MRIHFVPLAITALVLCKNMDAVDAMLENVSDEAAGAPGLFIKSVLGKANNDADDEYKLPKRFLVKGKKTDVKNKVSNAKGKMNEDMDDLGDDLSVVQFDTEEDLAAFEATLDIDMEIEEDYVRTTQRLMEPKALASVDDSLLRQALGQEEASQHRQLTRDSGNQIITYGLQTIFQGIIPESSYYPTEVSKKLCIIDSGLDTTHPDLSQVKVEAADGMSDFSDCGKFHGTHVAGTIVAEDNNQGILGIYPGADLLVIKMFGGNDCGFNYSERVYATSLLRAVNKCVDQDASIVSISVGGVGALTRERNVFARLAAQGVIFVAASGNTGNSVYNFPASYPSVISVGATDKNDSIPYFSTHNDQVDIVAPGQGILSTVGHTAFFSVTTSNKVYALRYMDYSAEVGADGVTKKGCLCDITSCPNECNGRVCVIPRGEGSFPNKALACEAAGGVAAIMYNSPSNQGFIGGTLDAAGVVKIPVFDTTASSGESMVNNFNDDASWDIPATGIPYDYYDGTSMAVPYVSGAAFLLWNKYPNCAANEIKSALLSSAKDLGASGVDSYSGHGLLQYWKAVQALEEMPCSPTPLGASTRMQTPALMQSSTLMQSSALTQPPTQAPTDSPTQAPTDSPTQAPTDSPTQAPTDAPTQVPSDSPTQAPIAPLVTSFTGYIYRTTGNLQSSYKFTKGKDSKKTKRSKKHHKV